MGTKNRFMIFSLFLIFMAVFGFGGTAEALLSAVSPNTDPVNGYPAWYQDGNGLKLGQCQTPDPLCISAPVDPADPVSVALGVGEESFYWVSEALIDMPTLAIPNPPNAPGIGGQALLVLALEEAFAGGPPLDGDQVVFARIRIRIDAPVVGVYMVTHPYGVKQFNVVAPGRRAVNDTIDMG